jgi:hypothetical protein
MLIIPLSWLTHPSLCPKGKKFAWMRKAIIVLAISVCETKKGEFDLKKEILIFPICPGIKEEYEFKTLL